MRTPFSGWFGQGRTTRHFIGSRLAIPEEERESIDDETRHFGVAFRQGKSGKMGGLPMAGGVVPDL
jgi:hypothetical protein